MARVLVWDLPTRLVHWTLAGSFLGAFVIAAGGEDEGALFPVHVGLGLVAAFVVGLRVVWGVIGSTPSRWSAFAWSLDDLAAYAREVLGGGPIRRWVGHNPGSSWVAALVFAGVVGLAVTGVLMSWGSEAAEEVHEVLAWSTMATVGVHLAGLAWHTLRHREPIGLAMVDGRREDEPRIALSSARAVPALVMLVLTGAWAGGLARGYDPAAGTIRVPVLGLTVGGEGEGGEGGEWEDED
jgi:cytochrome b